MHISYCKYYDFRNKTNNPLSCIPLNNKIEIATPAQTAITQPRPELDLFSIFSDVVIMMLARGFCRFAWTRAVRNKSSTARAATYIIHLHF